MVGRKKEMAQILAILRAGKNVLLEGPVGVGKTSLANHACQLLNRPVFRIDGDSRATDQKLTGWFDPPAVIQKGYHLETFIDGPLVSAMKKGGVLFINELNRLPESVQNVLLPALDERKVNIPKLKSVSADLNFRVIATQNPKEFVATSHLSEALLDRFELVILDYPSEVEEKQILSSHLESLSDELIQKSVSLIRSTRTLSRVRRGASIRAGISLAQIAHQLGGTRDHFVEAAEISLPTRIELEREKNAESSAHEEIKEFVRELAENVWNGTWKEEVKKNFTHPNAKPLI